MSIHPHSGSLQVPSVLGVPEEPSFAQEITASLNELELIAETITHLEEERIDAIQIHRPATSINRITATLADLRRVFTEHVLSLGSWLVESRVTT